jgi:hypothetical protein
VFAKNVISAASRVYENRSDRAHNPEVGAPCFGRDHLFAEVGVLLFELRLESLDFLESPRVGDVGIWAEAASLSGVEKFYRALAQSEPGLDIRWQY